MREGHPAGEGEGRWHPWAEGAAASLIVLLVYIFSLAPSVTFLDSGELIVAAQHFGVPHPPGYPLWTLLTGLFQLLPLGNAAWEANFFSALCAATAIGLLTALTSASAREFFPLCAPWFRRLVCISGGVSAGLGLSVWSQAVIAEVYSLHLLLVALFLISLFAARHRPNGLRGFLLPLFLFTLAFGNHHLVLGLSPLYLLALFFYRRDHWVQGAIWLTLLGSYGYGAFVWLSANEAYLPLANRFMGGALVLTVGYILLRSKKVDWGFPVRAAALVMVALSVYLYLPVASLTNPPMDWGYARERSGFFHVLNRSQFPGPLSLQIDRTLGRVLGLESSPSGGDKSPRAALVERSSALAFIPFLLGKIGASYSILGVLLMLAALLLAIREGPPLRPWIVLLAVGFGLAAFLQPVIDRAPIDWAGWSLQMPYHGVSYCLAAMLAAYGSLALAARWGRSWPAGVYVLAGISLIPPAYAFWSNYSAVNLRDNWLGWEMGVEMTANLPEGAVLLGGSDPGRFIPTYMIFGEWENPSKRLAADRFDRRDLFLIAQNQLILKHYRKTLADTYGPQRPAASGPAGFLFRREALYPPESLKLITERQVRDIISRSGANLATEAGINGVCSMIAKALWIANEAERPFFVEFSFLMPWVLPHAVPHGLVLEVSPVPVSSFDPAILERDRSYWQSWMDRLATDPVLRGDVYARQFLAGCRTGIAIVYEHHEMEAEAALAFDQALELFPITLRAAYSRVMVFARDRDLPGIEALVKRGLAFDPYQTSFRQLQTLLETPEGRERIFTAAEGWHP